MISTSNQRKRIMRAKKWGREISCNLSQSQLDRRAGGREGLVCDFLLLFPRVSPWEEQQEVRDTNSSMGCVGQAV